jgi:hypothetical protein
LRDAVRAANTRRDTAPVICAEMLLHHGFSDDAIVDYLARSWPLDRNDCQTALDAAHILVRREHPHDHTGSGD